MGWLVRVALVVGILWVPGTTWADDHAIERLAHLLSDYESMPDMAPLVAQGEPTAALLYALYVEADRPTVVRVRALRALASFPASSSTVRLITVVNDERAKPVFVREAALGLAQRAGEAALSPLTTLLRRADPQVRHAAVEALGRIGTIDARARLAAHRDHESDLRVRDALDAVLTSAPTQE